MAEETNAAEAFEAEAGIAPVVNTSGVDAATVATTKKQKFYTEEDLAKVRSQEKEKLYPQIESLKQQVEVLSKEKQERDARKAEKAALKEQEELQKIAEKEQEAIEKELSAKDLIKKKEQEWKEQLERERQERERAFALLEQERTFTDLQAYKQGLIEQERDNIIPELVDLIAGNTKEEIETSIQNLKARSEKILESAQTAMQTARKEMIGTRATLPPAGPLETNSEQRALTAEEIRSMSMNDYAKYRSRILSDAAQGKSRGLFG